MFIGVCPRLSNNFDEMKQQIIYDERYKDVELIEDIQDQYNHIMNTLIKYNSMAVQEDFQGWSENSFSKECAKLLLIDQDQDNVQHIFFDDRAEEDDDCIVDTRDVFTNEIIAHNKYIDKYVVRVDPLKAILEPDYFIKLIDVCEASRDQELGYNKEEVKSIGK